MTLLPITLIVAFTCMFGFLLTPVRHAARFRGSSKTYFLALSISNLLGSLVLLGLLIFYGYTTAWYWPLALMTIASLVGGLLFGYLYSLVGELVMSMVAFAGWPTCAVLTYSIIKDIAQ